MFAYKVRKLESLVEEDTNNSSSLNSENKLDMI